MSDPKDRMPSMPGGSHPGLAGEDTIQDRNLAVQGSPDGEDDEEMSDARLAEGGVSAVDDDNEADMDEEDMEDDELDEDDVDETDDTSGSTRLTDETPPRGYR